MSPLLYVLYIEPLAAAIRADGGIRGLRLPGGGGRVVKLAQYADDTTLILSCERSVVRALGVLARFARVSGAKLNVGKSRAKFFGRWEGRRESISAVACAEGPLRVLGVGFGGASDAVENWAERLQQVRMKLGLWKTRRLSITGKILVVKAEVLPALIFLASVFPLPPRLRRAAQGMVFKFVWAGYEYVVRELMVQPIERGGRGGPKHTPEM